MKILKKIRNNYLKKNFFFNIYIETQIFLKFFSLIKLNLNKIIYLTLFYFYNNILKIKFIKGFFLNLKKKQGKIKLSLMLKYNKINSSIIKYYLHSPNIICYKY